MGSDVIRAMTERIVERFRPLRVILFGSHARGEAGPRSDVDLLVVLAAAEDKRRLAADIQGELGGFRVATDVVVTTPAEIARLGNLVGTVLRPALREGRVLYRRPIGPAAGEQQGDGADMEAGPVDDAERSRETGQWLRYARGDLTAARALRRTPEVEPRHACWLAQQAAEKALKATLVWFQIDFPFSHDLNLLRDLVPESWPMRQEVGDLRVLSRWAVEARYPAPIRDATAVDAGRAVGLAERVVASVARDLVAHGFREAEAP